MERLNGFKLPWTASTDGRVIEDATRRQVAYLDGDTMQADRHRIGKAQLFAAAPELAEALKELLRVDDAWHGAVNSEMSHARSMARAALKKAGWA